LNYQSYFFLPSSNQEALSIIRQYVNEQPPPQSGNIYFFPETLPNALSLIQQGVSSESEDSIYFTYLADLAPTEEEKKIITDIRNDEITHYNMFFQIFYDLTGNRVPALTQETFLPPSSYCEGLKKAILKEQEALENYRQILFAMSTSIHINLLTDVIMDEFRHGSLFNYLYARNNCRY
jgi:rubrerythrin